MFTLNEPERRRRPALPPVEAPPIRRPARHIRCRVPWSAIWRTGVVADAFIWSGLQAAREAETAGFEQPQRSGFWVPVTPVIRRIPCTAASHLTRAATAAVPLPRADGPRVQPIATRPSGSGGPWVPDRRGAAYQRGARGGGYPRSRILTCGTASPHGGLARGPARQRGGFHRCLPQRCRMVRLGSIVVMVPADSGAGESPAAAARLDADSSGWLQALGCAGPAREAALGRLHE